MLPMTATETSSYLKHHLVLAARTLFSDDATALIHRTSRGYPVRRRACRDPTAPPPGEADYSATVTVAA
jgi:hypothetical protein